MNKLNEYNELYNSVNQNILYTTLFDVVNLNLDNSRILNTSQQNIKKQYIELLSQLTNTPIITDEEFINKVNEISKIGTIIICYIPNIDIEIIGSGTIIYEPKIIHGGKSVGHIEDIIVDKNHRNKGIAQNILNILIELAKNKCYKVILDCKEELTDFYSKVGFNKNGNQMAKYF
uniref:N-acetyltransferase domain-containing protein n=1 Tax=viral metagenome TaxID=1070528 RepID=A0A6C0D1P2_9ZZZZ